MVNRDTCAVVWRTNADRQEVQVWRNTIDIEEFEEQYDSDSGRMVTRKLIRPGFNWHVVDSNGELVTGELLEKVCKQYWDVINDRIQKFYAKNPDVIFGVPDKLYFID